MPFLPPSTDSLFTAFIGLSEPPRLWAQYLFLGLGVLSLANSINALWPRYRPPGLAVFSFFAGWLTAELPVHHLLGQGVVSGALFLLGGAPKAPGWLGLSAFSLSFVLLGVCLRDGAHARSIIRDALLEAVPEISPDDFPAPGRPNLLWRDLVFWVPLLPKDIHVVRDQDYAGTGNPRHLLDIYRKRGPLPRKAPVLMEVHGGGWVLGNKREQGLPLLYTMARAGWVGVSANYRLSPKATFPDQLLDLKKALLWIRRNIHQHGGDPDFVAITGGSAGGHLASLMALTANLPRYQPGFEDVDTRLAGCVSFYGVYDLADEDGLWPHRGLQQLMEKHVLKATRKDAPELYHQASPRSLLKTRGAHAPPFFLLHGGADSLVPVATARRFHQELEKVSPNPCPYAELPRAQHAFDVFYCLRSRHSIAGAKVFLTWLHRKERRNPRDIR